MLATIWQDTRRGTGILLLTDTEDPTRLEVALGEAGEAVTGDERRELLRDIIGQGVIRGIPGGFMLGVCGQVNEVACAPPLQAFEVGKLVSGEVERCRNAIVENAIGRMDDFLDDLLGPAGSCAG